MLRRKRWVPVLLSLYVETVFASILGGSIKATEYISSWIWLTVLLSSIATIPNVERFAHDQFSYQSIFAITHLMKACNPVLLLRVFALNIVTICIVLQHLRQPLLWNDQNLSRKGSSLRRDVEILHLHVFSLHRMKICQFLQDLSQGPLRHDQIQGWKG